MKRIFASIMTFAAMACLFASCEEVSKVAVETEGNLSFVISQDKVATKASTASVAFETKINTLDVYLFEAGQTLYYHERCVNGSNMSDSQRFEWSFNNTAGTFSGTLKKIPVTTSTSKYTLVFVANMPASALSGKMTIADIEDVAVNLGNMSRVEGEGFAMYAKKANIVVNGGDTPTAVDGNIELERFVSRVRLVSVMNTIPASANYSNGNKITVNGIFLSNSASAWKLGGVGNPTNIANVAGKHGNSFISPSVEPDFAIMGYFPTAVEVAQSASATAFGWGSYAMPTTTANAGSSSPKLVVCAIVNGTQYYYPIELIKGTDRTGFERNKTYDITVSISGTGSPDPDVPVVRGNLSATVSVKDWVSGNDYSENI